MTENKLLERVKTGDRKAFHDLVRKHRPVVMALAYDLTGSVEDAEDLAQEVFVRVYRSLGRFRGDAKLSTWLYRITVNTWINQNRRGAQQQRSRESSFDCNEDTTDTITNELNRYHTEDPERVVETSLLSERIIRAMDTLTERERSVFVLRYLHELKISEVGLSLGISEGSVKTLSFRAIKKMQKHLAMYRTVKGTVI